MDYWVYMLKSIEKNPVTYVGHTKDLKNRLKLHNTGKGAKYGLNSDSTKFFTYL